ncbi:MAG: phage terminase large subunit [Humidesulfovibrio sp.]|uniref:phage terminase large subunit n=1 Tax=Humidesulfovibrio sp. TaxID=2910988 RepID=UPI0027EAF34A|nr:phage terminase large subunit [Humidesulfovibrio sp.]MDQ7836023.1 phage terminase large subunit [Humidesulfovibrio sp.]
MKRRTLGPGGGGSLLQNFVLNLQTSLPAANAEQLVFKPEMSYHDFILQSWHIIEPARPFVDGWHIGAICEHMEAVATFEIRELLVNMPPRHMKSIGISVCFVPWVWTWAPGRRSFNSSYELTLARRDNQKARTIIESPWYQERWGSKVSIKSDQNEKSKFENTHGGSRFVSSSGGKATGEGGDYVFCDDPHNVKDVSQDRETKRLSVLDWWDNSMSNRLDDPERGAFVVVGQRVHENDLSGHLLEQGGWVHLCLPAEYEGRRYVKTPLGFEDPRTKEGELLWPERFTGEALEKIKRKMHEAEYAGQFQQEPTPPGGGIFKWEWFQSYTELPRFERIVDFWDTAQSVKDGAAYSVRERWGEAQNGYYLLHVLRERMDYPTLKQRIVDDYDAGGVDEVVVEDKSSGTSVIQDLQKDTKVPVIPYVLGKDGKETRARAQASTVKGGNVWVPESAPWLPAFKNEVIMFPNGKFKDQVDVMAEALDYLKNGSGLTQDRDMS